MCYISSFAYRTSTINLRSLLLQRGRKVALGTAHEFMISFTDSMLQKQHNLNTKPFSEHLHCVRWNESINDRHFPSDDLLVELNGVCFVAIPESIFHDTTGFILAKSMNLPCSLDFHCRVKGRCEEIHTGCCRESDANVTAPKSDNKNCRSAR